MDTLTRMYAEAWSRLSVEIVELVVVPAPRTPPDVPDEGGLRC